VRAIAADANPERARSAALALRRSLSGWKHR
jgi:hypothetical protein